MARLFRDVTCAIVGAAAATLTTLKVLENRVEPEFWTMRTETGAQPLRYGVPVGDQILVKKSYVASTNYKTRQPAWVAEHLRKEFLQVNASRENSRFKADESVPEPMRATLEDYLRSGYSRGHLAPASNHRLSKEDLDETFLLSANIVPQDMSMNGCDWLRLELFAKGLSKSFDDVFVISGPIFSPDSTDKKMHFPVIGPNGVHVPTHMFKLILTENAGGKDKSMAAFIIPNRPIRKERPLTAYQVPLEELEKRAGLTFFDRLDRSLVGDLCLTKGCEVENDERILQWRLLGRIKAAKTINEAEAAFTEAQKCGIDQEWLKKMFEDEYNKRKTYLTEKNKRRSTKKEGDEEEVN